MNTNTHSDRELLEIAARLVGYEAQSKYYLAEFGIYVKDTIDGYFYWNPLRDVEEAMQLAIEFGVAVQYHPEQKVAHTRLGEVFVEIPADDAVGFYPELAVCRAIVLATVRGKHVSQVNEVG
jgi:hypothetical protein